MTEQPKTIQFSPDEWKGLCVLNATQLSNFLQQLPAMSEGGTSGLTADHMNMINGHLARFGAFLNGWQRARAEGSVAQPEAPKAEAAAPVTNGEAKAKRGGWPKGKKRTPRADVQQVQ